MAAAWASLAVLVGFFVAVAYLMFLIVRRAFRSMGFTTLEAVMIVGASFLLGYGILDGVVGVPLSALPLFSYGLSWVVAVNVGGAVVPVVLSGYLIIKYRLSAGLVALGVMLVGVAAFVVTAPDPQRGIVAGFPWWLAPVVVASLGSVVLMRGREERAAPLVYVIGVCGVLVGADVVHLVSLLQMPVEGVRTAVIGGASVFDMVFTTGLLAVLLDGLLVVQRGKKKEEEVGSG